MQKLRSKYKWKRKCLTTTSITVSTFLLFLNIKIQHLKNYAIITGVQDGSSWEDFDDSLNLSDSKDADSIESNAADSIESNANKTIQLPTSPILDFSPGRPRLRRDKRKNDSRKQDDQVPDMGDTQGEVFNLFKQKFNSSNQRQRTKFLHFLNLIPMIVTPHVDF